ncbi:MAG: type III-B CRISPR-associated protein Cas10/Cmr2, partial [Rhodospirillales bacterium]|nr:type III-B CRISPR-associated protein Cas10/Cmr2 [Rhodospirillales bacterium]
MADPILHVSIGPVQQFVGQARRTRDLWAGSFLLSWLAGQLMAGVMRRGGRVLFPLVGTVQAPRNPLLAAIVGGQSEQPSTGTLPNRFKASVPAAFDPEDAAEDARQAWQRLAESVWGQFVAGAAIAGRGTRAIWERQIDGFWELQWMMGAEPGDGSDGSWLDQRKNWRSHWPPCEGGDHCTAMGDWQEISGFVRGRERHLQDAFWRNLQDKVGRLDIRDGERLCAVALVKRLFPKLGTRSQKHAIGWPLDAANWPSTAYMAAVPWLMHVGATAARCSKLGRYLREIEQHVGPDAFARLKGERATRLPGLDSLGEHAGLDGNLFLEAALANPRATPLRHLRGTGTEHLEDPDADTRERLLGSLKRLGGAVGGSAMPFYALLLMDGDRLGNLLRENDEQSVSAALARFVDRVDDTVAGRNGVTVYAGGDDVLAILPVTCAVDCAIRLRHAYDLAFQPLKLDAASRRATASAAIVFAHYHCPLGDVLKCAHTELDETAKEGNGRNSLALAVML